MCNYLYDSIRLIDDDEVDLQTSKISICATILEKIKYVIKSVI
jgi:hypothetical protein